MSVLWVMPLLCLTAGAVLVTLALRETTRSAIALRDECARLGDLRSALVELRADADGARLHLDGIRSRTGRSRTDR